MHRAHTTRLPEQVTPLHLASSEGFAISVLDSLLGAGALRDRNHPTSISPASRDLIAAGAARMRVAAMRFLVESGGRRETTVLRSGKRVTGRIWDASIQDGFSLKFTHATEVFWPEIARVVVELRAHDAAPIVRGSDTKATRKHRKMLRDVFATGNIGSTGDWVFFALVRKNLSSLRFDAEDSTAIAKRLSEASPLVTLLYPDEQFSYDEVLERYERLLQPNAVLILESVRDRISEAFVAHAEATWSGRSQAAVFITRAATLSRSARALISAADNARRMDVLLPLASFSAQLVTRILPRGDQARAGVGWLRGITTVAQRDEVIAALRGIVEIPTELLRQRAVLAAEGYGYERYEEAQVYVRGIDQILSPHRAMIDELQRGLSDTLG